MIVATFRPSRSKVSNRESSEPMLHDISVVLNFSVLV